MGGDIHWHNGQTAPAIQNFQYECPHHPHALIIIHPALRHISAFEYFQLLNVEFQSFRNCMQQFCK